MSGFQHAMMVAMLVAGPDHHVAPTLFEGFNAFSASRPSMDGAAPQYVNPKCCS
jgi:hypothetical protein